MGHRLRDESEGIHHIGARGNNKQRIFLTDRDRLLFLRMVDRIAKKHHWRILTYALMRTHYHLVLRIEEGRLAQGMCELNTGYAVSFNAEHGRKNHLFGRRYWSDVATSDEHLRKVVRYVLQNPRRAGVHGPLESHAWTSYRASVGLDFGLDQFARDELLSFFGGTPLHALAEFKSFCEQPSEVDLASVVHVRWQPPAPNARERVT